MYWPEDCPRTTNLPLGDINEVCLARWSKKEPNAPAFSSGEKSISRAELMDDVISLGSLLRERKADTRSVVIAVKDDLLRLKCILACRLVSLSVAISDNFASVTGSDLPILTDVLGPSYNMEYETINVKGSQIYSRPSSYKQESARQFASEFSILGPDLSERETYSEKALLFYLGSFCEFLALRSESRLFVSLDEIPLKIFASLVSLYSGATLDLRVESVGKQTVSASKKNYFLLASESAASSLIANNSNPIDMKIFGWVLIPRLGQFNPRVNSNLEKQLHVPVINCLYVPSFGIPISNHPSWNLPSSIGLPITNSEGRIGQSYFGQTFNLAKVGQEGKLLILDSGLNRLPKALQNSGIIMGSKGRWHNTSKTAAMDNNGLFYLI